MAKKWRVEPKALTDWQADLVNGVVEIGNVNGHETRVTWAVRQVARTNEDLPAKLKRWVEELRPSDDS